MTSKQLLFLAAAMNVMMMLLLIHKQNIIIADLHDLQKLQEQRSELLEEKKELTLALHKLTQLSNIESHGKNELQLKSMTLKDVHKISRLPENSKDADATSRK